MSQPHPTLGELLRTVEELCSDSGKNPDEVLDAAELSRATGVPETDVQTLLAGGTPADVKPDTMVRDRVRFLCNQHAAADGSVKDINEIASAIEQTPTWTKKLVAGEAKPNIIVGAALCKLYGVSPNFLTDQPAEALRRELRRIAFDLKAEANPAQVLADLDVRHISGRSNYSKPELAQLARLVASIVTDLDTVQSGLKRLGYEEDPR
ncbi:hypothetical protein ACF073_27160 [Streptomyces sp. NPDC015171]|uniref:hypothetical protein n=1 Tax=Streptomyces sp. NPDC015171 TaxID=3364945 RepID=UPI0036FB58C3